MRILVVKLGSIGDIVHTLPALAAIKKADPHAEVSWAVERRSAEILRGNPLIDRLIEVDTRLLRSTKIDLVLPELRKQVKEIRQFKFDVSLDFQGLLKSAVIAKLSGAPKRWGFQRKELREPASRIFLTDTVKIPRQTHIITKNLLLARRAFGLEGPFEIEFPIATHEEHRAEAEEIVRRVGADFAVLNPAGGWVTKLWHAEKFGRLADKIWYELGIVPVIATAPSESRLAEQVIAASRSGKIVSTEPSLKGFVELVKKAKVYVGGDTGPTHLAVAAGAPVVGLFGPTEWWRNGSPNPADVCVERMDIDCRVDCHRRTCGNWICMDTDAETVFGAVRRRLGQK